MLVLVDLIAVVVAVVGLITAFLARKIWLLVEGELADSWRWILPSVPVYAISFTILILYNFVSRYGVLQPVLMIDLNIQLLEQQTMFNMQIWQPIILVLRNIQVLAETLFLALVLMGLIRQYRLFQKLADR